MSTVTPIVGLFILIGAAVAIVLIYLQSSGFVKEWYYEKYPGTALPGCANPTNDKEGNWQMKNAYRYGGTKDVHWKYKDSAVTLDCLENWDYYESDGTTLKESNIAKYTVENGKEWCPLPVYRPGGVKGKQWDRC